MKEVILKANYDDGFLYNISRQFDATIKILNFLPSEDEKIDAYALLQIHSKNGRCNEILSFLENIKDDCKYFCSYKLINITKDFMLISLGLCSSYGSKAIYKTGCFLNDCQIDNEGIFFNLLTNDEGSLYNFINYLIQCGFKIEILKKYDFYSKCDLTKRETEILRLAFDHGYFDTPKKTKLWELSNYFDIKVSTLNEILKKAEKKIISNYFLKE